MHARSMSLLFRSSFYARLGQRSAGINGWRRYWGTGSWAQPAPPETCVQQSSTVSRQMIQPAICIIQLYAEDFREHHARSLRIPPNTLYTTRWCYGVNHRKSVLIRHCHCTACARCRLTWRIEAKPDAAEKLDPGVENRATSVQRVNCRCVRLFMVLIVAPQVAGALTTRSHNLSWEAWWAGPRCIPRGDSIFPV